MAKASSSKMSIADLEKALQATKNKVGALEQKREALLAKVEDVEKEIAALEGAPPAPPEEAVQEEAAPEKAAPKKAARKKARGRRGQVSLIQACVDVLAKTGETMTGDELVAAVTAAGYKSKSKNLKQLMFSQIYGEKRIVRPERGRFQIKSGAVKAEEKAKK